MQKMSLSSLTRTSLLSRREEVEDAFRRLNDDSEIGMGWNGRNQNFTVCFFLIEREFIVDFMVRKLNLIFLE